MKFFKYAENGTSDLSTMYDIFCSIRSLENYAKKIYKNRWEDALDDALFHMLRNYDPSKGPIDNYAIKLVKTIKKNEFGYEKPSEYITELGDESQEDVPDTVERVEEIKKEIAKSVELQNCIKDMAKHFVRDFRFFCSMKANVRKDSYSDVFEKYSHKVIK